MFITFEGVEGSGKSSQCRRLYRRLLDLGVPVRLTFEPGATPLGENLRRLLLDPRHRGQITALAELLLYEADRAQHVAAVVAPALRQGIWVLCDRFYDATLAYQGYGRRQNVEFIAQLNHAVTGGIRPHLTFLLDLPVETGLARVLRRNQGAGHDRLESEDRAFHEAVRAGYLKMAGSCPERFVVLDGLKEEAGLAAMVFETIRPFLPSQCAED